MQAGARAALPEADAEEADAEEGAEAGAEARLAAVALPEVITTLGRALAQLLAELDRLPLSTLVDQPDLG